MAYSLRVEGPTGASLAATIQRNSDGYYWNPTAVAFQSAPSFTDKRINLTEGTSELLCSYSVTINSLGDAGDVTVFIHDTGASNKVVTSLAVYIEDGNEASSSRNADVLLRRAWATAKAAGHGDAAAGRNLLGLMARFVNRWEVVGSDIVIYDSDDTTPFLTIAVSASSVAEPIVGMNPPA